MPQPTSLTLLRLAYALAPHAVRPPPVEPGPPWSGWASDLIDLAVCLQPGPASRALLEEAAALPSAAAAARGALLGNPPSAPRPWAAGAP
jgi:hypothetical protein